MRFAAMLVVAAALMPVATSAQTSQTAAVPASRMRSTVEALRISVLTRLPRAPASASGEARESCQHLLAEPQSSAGQQVANAGWGVTGEATLGPYQTVSFVGSFEPGTSGSCQLGNGNVGLFQNGELAAVIYAPPGGRRSVRRAVVLEGNGLRIWDGDFLSQPIADLRLGADGSLTVQPMAVQEAVCNGTASVPNIFGRPINEARALLRRSGWSPVSQGRRPREQLDGRVADLVRRGVPEVQDCSGTGFGFCSYGYRAGSATLNVITAGDDNFPVVSDYAVQCKAPG